MTMICAEEQQ